MNHYPSGKDGRIDRNFGLDQWQTILKNIKNKYLKKQTPPNFCIMRFIYICALKKDTAGVNNNTCTTTKLKQKQFIILLTIDTYLEFCMLFILFCCYLNC